METHESLVGKDIQVDPIQNLESAVSARRSRQIIPWKGVHKEEQFITG